VEKLILEALVDCGATAAAEDDDDDQLAGLKSPRLRRPKILGTMEAIFFFEFITVFLTVNIAYSGSFLNK